MSKEKTYSIEEVDVIMKKHIQEQWEILRKNLREAKAKSQIEYV